MGLSSSLGIGEIMNAKIILVLKISQKASMWKTAETGEEH
jgi:hypothetical protein